MMRVVLPSWPCPVAVVDGHDHFPEAAFAELCLDREATPTRQNGLQAAELRARGHLFRKAACDVLQQVCCTRQTRRCEYLYFVLVTSSKLSTCWPLLPEPLAMPAHNFGLREWCVC